VLYNGTEPYPDEAVLHLSEAFEDTEYTGNILEPALELKVRVYNINRGHNEPIIRRCEKLDGYSELIAKVREFEGDLAGSRKGCKLSAEERGEAMKRAIRWCIEHNILRPFLETHGTEVVNMLMTEWKLEDALVVEREEGREEGWAEGLTEGLEKGRKAIARNALTKGLSPQAVSEITGLDLETIKNLST
jgi:hypothetical protein